MVNLVKYGANVAMNKTLEQIFEENNLIPNKDIIREKIIEWELKEIQSKKDKDAIPRETN